MTYDTINDAQTVAGNGEGTLLANRYRIVRQLGQGGMGSVWLAEDTQLDGQSFAIKMLPAILVANKRAYAQLKAEALVAMKLTHPNIVTLRAFEANDGNPFLVMDYIDGQTLDDCLAEKGTFTEEEVIRVLRPVAAALDYAHAKGVVHRDVKPGNVMIAKDGTPYILDFGIAREIQETMTRVTGKLSSGTLLYMSPEQLMGEKPTPAQDVYSFAAMAYECLKGEPPFSHGQIEFQIMNKEPDPLPGGTQLVASVMAGLAKKSEGRPATCAAVLDGSISRRDTETSSYILGARPSLPSPPMNDSCRVEHAGTVAAEKAHKGIQLWKDGPYWAETNIGAENLWESGYYFWWGDTVGYKREPINVSGWFNRLSSTQKEAWVPSCGSSLRFSFCADNIPTYGKGTPTLQREGWITADGVLVPKHDAAHVQWGDGWRMPTQQELNDLCEKCDWRWTTMGEKNGYTVCGRGDYASASIFLPAAGYGYDSYLFSTGSYGNYWSSSPGSGSSYDAWYLYFDSGSFYGGSNYRYGGRSVRPVRGFAE